MNTLFKSITIVFLAVSFCAAQGYTPPDSAGELRNSPQREEAFKDWGLGLFVHWSLDSQLGSVISHHMDYASDKHLDRVVNELPKTFNPRHFNPDRWMEIAKLAGVKYMVFTAKHHSGFCMWDTATTDFNIMNTPYGKDVTKMYVDSCRKYGIKVGLYYSPEDFAWNYRQGIPARRAKMSNEQRAELHDFTKKQVKELLTQYGPIDALFLDGGHKGILAQECHKIDSNCIVTRGEMATPEQRLPKEPIPGPWETCFTLGNQWQYKPTNEDYKSGTTLINMLIETRAKGGNLLINVGPKPDGTLPEAQVERFRELALWMFVNDESVHNIRPCQTAGDKDVYYTQSKDGKYVYALLTQFTEPTPTPHNKLWPREKRKQFVLKDLVADASTSATVLGQDHRKDRYTRGENIEIRFKNTAEGLEMDVPRLQRLYNNRCWPNAVVLRFENVKFK